MYSEYIGDFAVLMNCQSRGDVTVVPVYLMWHHGKDLVVTKSTCHTAHPYQHPSAWARPSLSPAHS
jgi:hypothetical protein